MMMLHAALEKGDHCMACALNADTRGWCVQVSASVCAWVYPQLRADFQMTETYQVRVLQSCRGGRMCLQGIALHAAWASQCGKHHHTNDE